ncbi:MAG: 16S rRNA (guanine(966)-N(2))-methyltransferase RsmD [Bacteroidales bacterium]|nr:16S rRNA (guanine(966)-N(2))-methyltransferase RsmD [Bacteroidales bacterium]
MRIISGKYRGRQLNLPKGFKARPTTDYAKESLFNILSARYDFDEMNILDLFAGTGSIGLEFYSRGAPVVHMVEANFKHFTFIRKCIATLDAKGAMAIHSNIKTFLKGYRYKYDIIFADPPYNLPWLDTIPDLVFEAGVLKKEALFILEHPKDLNFSSHRFFTEHRYYGSVNFSFFNLSS